MKEHCVHCIHAVDISLHALVNKTLTLSVTLELILTTLESGFHDIDNRVKGYVKLQSHVSKFKVSGRS
jgi:hypothetical protein